MSAINLKQILPKTSRILSFKEILGEIERVQGVVEQIPTLTIENSKVLGTQDGYDMIFMELHIFLIILLFVFRIQKIDLK